MISAKTSGAWRKAVTAAALAVLPLGAIGSPAGETLVSIKAGALPPIADSVSQVLAVDRRIAALGANAFWMLDTNLAGWGRWQWHPDGEVVGVASGSGPEAFLLLGAQHVRATERVEGLAVESGSPRSRTLPPLPMPLTAARAALLGDTLFVAGTTMAGASKLLAIIPAMAAPVWATHAGVGRRGRGHVDGGADRGPVRHDQGSRQRG